MKHLNDQGIGCDIRYPVPLPVTPPYVHLGYGAEQFLVSCEIADKQVCLPVHADLMDSEIDFVIQEVKKVAK